MTLTPTALFESFDPQGRGWSCVFENPLAVYFARTLNEVVPLLQEADRASHDGQWAVLMLSYEAAPALDSAMEVRPSNHFPLAWLAVFGEAFPNGCRVESRSFLDPRWDASITESNYGRGIRDRCAIARGDCYQVNYTFPMECKFEGDAWDWYRALGTAQGRLLRLDRLRSLPRDVIFPGAFLRTSGERFAGSPDERHCSERALGF